ncbi:MAG: cation acetate symporter, partial [Tepidisphaeraceae bacterium]
IPQMVGAGALVKPLLGMPHWAGVLIVGTVVTLIVVTAGMVSTTWVQFIKGSLLVIFCAILTVMILRRGLSTDDKSSEALTQTVEVKPDGTTLLNGVVVPKGKAFGVVFPQGTIKSLPGGVAKTGPLGPWEYLSTFQNSTIATYTSEKKTLDDGSVITTYKQVPRQGSELLLPGGSPTFKGVRSEKLSDKLDFISLMLALFAGTASLPHILIRYYTVKDAAAARKSTIVGIASIGFFYILTLYLGLGAMTNGTLDVTNSNMAAPLLAKAFGEFPFAIVSAIAFTTVLGTVSGLIMAASGAVAHDLIEVVMGHKLKEHAKVGAAKWAALVVGIIAIILGILFEKLNVTFLVGWAFNIAASANLPALIMLLFWPRTTKQGITAAVIVGMVSSLAWILLSGQCFRDVYGLDPARAPVPFSQPGLVTIPLGFITLIVVSLMTKQMPDVREQ